MGPIARQKKERQVEAINACNNGYLSSWLVALNIYEAIVISPLPPCKKYKIFHGARGGGRPVYRPSGAPAQLDASGLFIDGKYVPLGAEET
jgi:hypothetical protein